MDDCDEFDELDVRYDDQYWITSESDERSLTQVAPPSVRFSVNDNAALYGRPAEVRRRPSFSEENCISLTSLRRRGFSGDLSESALRRSQCDFGIALELLLMECVPDPSGRFIRNCTSLQEMKTLRADEVEIMKSMYDDYYIEIIKDRIYVLYLKLPELTLYLHNNTEHALDYMHSSTADDAKKVEKLYNDDKHKYCKYFTSESGCRFGNNCSNRHVSLENQLIINIDLEVKLNNSYVLLFVINENTVVHVLLYVNISWLARSSHKVSSKDLIKATCLYKIEIRLNDHYPERSALVNFESRNLNLTSGQHMAITRKLLAECLSAADADEPCVYRLTMFMEEFSNYEHLL